MVLLVRARRPEECAPAAGAMYDVLYCSHGETGETSRVDRNSGGV